ncbi:MAG TPA: Rieske (2Fe-2S) protein [Xanthobacteraceae bacterium]|nr:Rieske (2Fe-2S) protein [Xanthobacteraceae bacterium]
MARHVVATVGEIAPGANKLVTVKGREIGLFNIKGEYFALANTCPHEGASLCKGKLVGLAESDEPGKYRLTRQGELLKCPWHGWEFDVRTGQSWCDPHNTYVRQYAVSVESGDDLLKGPYVLETFQVSVEENYVIIDM